MFEILNNDGATRVGRLTTNHGSLESPFFMPVATKMGVKYLGSEDLKTIGTQAIISNAFVLSLRPGVDLIEKLGGIHKAMNFDKVIFTDSGGFQKIRESFFIESNLDGVLFKSPFDGQKHLLTPEKAMDIEYKIGSDVAMVIDDMPPAGKDYNSVKVSTHRTHTWAVQCLKHHKKINKKGQLLFGIAQGGIFPDLREKSAKFIGSLDFDGFAFGGLAIGEPDEEMYKMVNLTIKFFPENKPRYLMGVGNPVHIINAVAHGVDCFDSIFPTMNARHLTLFTSDGKLRLGRKEFEQDIDPIDKNCDCFVCKNYSRAFIRHLILTNEPNGLHYASFHNIFFMKSFMEDIRESIKENRFEKFREDFLSKWID